MALVQEGVEGVCGCVYIGVVVESLLLLLGGGLRVDVLVYMVSFGGGGEERGGAKSGVGNRD